MKPAPANWPRFSSALYYEDPRAAIDFLCRAFGFEVRLVVDGEDGSLVHSELVYGGGLVMVSGMKADKFPRHKAPSVVGGVNTQNMMVYVDDVEAHFARAKAAGAKINAEPMTFDRGPEYWLDRGYECEDIGGHGWWFYERLRDAAT